MPPAFEVLLLNTTIPQIQAAQTGDTYVVPRDIAFSTVASFAAGAEATPSIVATGDTNTGIWFPAADTVAISTGGTSKLRLDSSGNLGLGVTPSAWPGASVNYNTFQFGVSSVTNVANAAAEFAYNQYIDSGGTRRYISSNVATRYRMDNGHSWFTAPSGTAGNAVTFTQAMTLDASGNLIVGTTASAGSSQITAYGAFNGQIAVQNSTNWSRLLQNSSDLYIDNAVGGLAGNIVFRNSSSTVERARITSGGNLLIGNTTASDRFVSEAGATGAAGLFITNNQLQQCVNSWNKATSGDNVFQEFYTEASATLRGSITYNRAGGLVAYNITSDYRAKDIIGPVTNSGVTIDALKVYEGKMKGATQSRPMLIAHEAQEFAPYAVTGEKDALNDDGTPKYQQVDVSSLVPLLLAEIQSLRARVAQLEGK